MCLKCNSAVSTPVLQWAVDPEAIISEALALKVGITTPTPMQLFYASINLPPQVLEVQSRCLLTRFFPQFPLATQKELQVANTAGMNYTVPIKGFKALKAATTIIGEVTSKVVTTGPDGYKPLAYLGTSGPVGYNIRMDAQTEMCRALRAARAFDLLRAALYGHLILVDTKDSDTEPTAMFDARITELVQSLICLSERWAKCRPTKLHHEMATQHNTSPLVVQCLSPSLFPDLNESLFNLIRDLLPSAFFRKLEDRLHALRSRTMNVFQFVVEIFEDDRTLPALSLIHI